MQDLKVLCLQSDIVWDDPEIGIDWPTQSAPLLSKKDAVAARMTEMMDLLF